MKDDNALLPCPSCGVRLGPGTNDYGLARHVCRPRKSASQIGEEVKMLVRLTYLAPTISPRAAASAVLRLALLRFAEQPAADLGELSRAINATARLCRSGCATPREDADRELREWIEGAA